MSLTGKRKDERVFEDKHLAEVEELNFKVFKALSLTSVLVGLLLSAGTFIPSSYLSSQDFRILFLASTAIFEAFFLLGLFRTPFLLHHSTFLLYVNIFFNFVFFFLLDRVIAFHRGSEVPYTLILGLLMVQPIIITDKSNRLLVWTLISVLECIVLSVLMKPLHIAMNDIINCSVMSVVGIITGRISRTYFLNYTEMKVQEKDIEIRAAEEANKAKSEFLALISHEVRTPLNAVVNLNEMILRESSDQTAIGYSRGIKQACRTLTSLINDILDFSKLNSGEFSLIPIEYSLDGLLNDTYNMILPRVREKGLAFSIYVQEDTPNSLQGDDLRIKQCLMNLLSNAVKYTDSGSIRLSVSWQQLEEDDEKNIYLTFTVMDTGTGIKESDIDKIAYPFERLDELKNRSVEGSGLGLAIVHGILGKMGSSLRVKSEYGKGSIFSFTIWQPVTANTPIGKYTPRPLSESGTRAARYGTFTAPGARILIVDDLPVNLDVICSLLKCTELQIDTATSGREALQYISGNHYDVVFIDHRMPGMDGIETLHVIQQLGIPGTEDIKFIALTANAAKDSRSQYLQEGFHDYLSKPVDPQELEELLIRHLPVELVRLSAEAEMLPGLPEGGYAAAAADGPAAAAAATAGVAPTAPAVTSAAGLPAAEEDDFLRAYRQIDGADPEAAMKYCRNPEALKKAVQAFCSDAEQNAGSLMRETGGGNFRECGMTAHKLKTELRLIGFTELSQTAARLEEYADSEYAAGLRLLVPDFTEQVILCSSRLGVCLQDLNGGMPAEAKQPLPDGVLRDAVSALGECAEAGDLRTAGHILEMLEEYELPAGLQELVTQAEQAVRNQHADIFRELSADMARMPDSA